MNNREVSMKRFLQAKRIWLEENCEEPKVNVQLSTSTGRLKTHNDDNMI